MSKKHKNSDPVPPEEAKTPEMEADEVTSGLEDAAEEIKEPKQPSPEELLAEEKNKYAYLMAEYQNYRRRSAKEISDARFNGMADVLSSFLKIADFLAMAESAASKSDNIDAIKQGLQMIIAEYSKTFDELGVKKVSSVGELFNPELHEAVVHEPSEEVEENRIIKEWNSAYKLGERLLRPARVVVSSGAKKEENAPADDAEKQG